MPHRPRSPLRGKLALIGAPSLLVYMAMTWLISSVLHLSGWRLWAFRLALWLLGLVAFGLIYWFAKRSAESQAEEEGEEDDELESLLATAKSRLAASPTIGVATLNRLPLVIVLGPSGSAKTSTILNSGLDPDLLAGAAREGDEVAPTPTGNLWYAHNTVLLEAGRTFNEDPSRWRRLIRAIRPQTLSNVLSGRPQAPRVAVVCLSCEALLRPDASTTVPATAQQLRSVLVDLAHGFGTPLPVYVLFTKADRIPHFAEYVANLNREEAEEVLGATLRWPTARELGRSAEQEYQRINSAFQRLFSSLAEKRLKLLEREAVTERKASAYEFPREFRKLGPLATRFMVDLCRPSQLRISPVLRGFYFSGVRAVVVSDAASEAQPEAGVSSSGRIAATEVFKVGRHQEPAAVAVGPRQRKIPQWIFLGRLFRDVINRDRMAMGVTRSGTHLTLRRRLVMGGAVALSLLLSSCFTVSYFGNRRLERRVVTAAAGLLDVRSREPELPTYESLRRLETLREQIARLTEYERGSPPLRLRWGLYRGAELLAPTRDLYLERLDHLILEPARQRLADSLRALPAVPAENAAFERTYSLLKAYLMTTIETARIDSTFLAPRLWTDWLAGRPIDDEREELARRQLDFFAGPLCDAESLPCAREADSRAVMRACTYLRGFSGPERYYQLMISGAASGIAPVRLSAVYPNTAGIIQNDYVVPGAFTPEGWEAVHAEIRSMDELAEAEAWVCEETAPPVDRAALASSLLERYHRDYVQHWRNFLSAAQVVRFGSTGQASAHLNELAGNESPLLKLLALVARSTRVEDQVIDSAFQPVHVVTPPEITDRFVSEANQSYINALMELQGLVDQAGSSGPGSGSQLASDALSAAQKARAEVQKLSQQFRIQGEAREVGATVTALLEQPVQNVSRLLGSLPARRINAAGAAFCNEMRGLVNRYPFNSRSTTAASLDEVSAIFQPGSGLLWRFYDETLTGILVERGTNVYGSVPGAAMRPTQGYVDFFNQAARLSRALWSENEREAGFNFTFKPTLSSSITSVRLTVDGQPRVFTQTRIPTAVIRWAGGAASSAVLSGEVRGREQELLRYDGTWALFRLFGQAEWQRVGSRYTVRWRLEPQGGEVVWLEAEVDLGGKPPILQPGYFSGVRNCVARIVR